MAETNRYFTAVNHAYIMSPIKTLNTEDGVNLLVDSAECMLLHTAAKNVVRSMLLTPHVSSFDWDRLRPIHVMNCNSDNSFQ